MNFLDYAERYRGEREIAGGGTNPLIKKWFKDSGHGWVDNDETPWCAAFVGGVLWENGFTNTKSLRARSYLDYGEKIEESDVRRGDIVILWRSHPESTAGHVAFFESFDKDRVRLFGGNQGNRVCSQSYARKRILGFRRPTYQDKISFDYEKDQEIKKEKRQAKAKAIIKKKPKSHSPTVLAGGVGAMSLVTPGVIETVFQTIDPRVLTGITIAGVIAIGIMLWRHHRKDQAISEIIGDDDVED